MCATEKGTVTYPTTTCTVDSASMDDKGASFTKKDGKEYVPALILWYQETEKQETENQETE